MRKLIVLVILFLSVTNVICQTNFALISSLINPAASDVAFGLNSGAADIYNMNPLSAWSNPAKLGYQKGLSYGYSHDPYLEDTFSDIYMRSSYLSFGWNGIGILMPAPSAESRWGNVMSFGTQEYIDHEGNLISSFESYESSSKFAVGVNTIEFATNFINNDFIKNLTFYGDISLGYNYDILYSKLGPSTGVTDHSNGTAESHSSGYGIIGRLSPFNQYNATNQFYRLDFTAGLYLLNPEKNRVTYNGSLPSEPLPYGTRSAFSGKFSIDLKIIPSFDNSDIRNFIDNIITVYYSQDNAQYGEEEKQNPGTWGEGLEITFFDFFSIRKGKYIDRKGELIGDTDGMGFNLNYKDIIQFQYNLVEFPGGGLQNRQDKTDFLFRIDLLRSYNLVKGK